MPKNNNEPACRLNPYDWKPGHGRPGPRSVRCPLADEVKVLEMLKKAAASPPWPPRAGAGGPRQLLSREIAGLSGQQRHPGGERGQGARDHPQEDPPQRHCPSRRSGAHPAAQGHRAGALSGPDAQGQDPRHLGGLPDYPKNSVRPELTKMYYPDYTPAHYNDLLFSSKGYAGPNGERFISMRQFYEQQSGQSYSVRVRWRAGIPPTRTPPTTAPTPPPTPSGSW